jgi:hypothetical protein
MMYCRVALTVGVADGAETGRQELFDATVGGGSGGGTVVLLLVLGGEVGGSALLRGALVGTEERDTKGDNVGLCGAWDGTMSVGAAVRGDMGDNVDLSVAAKVVFVGGETALPIPEDGGVEVKPPVLLPAATPTLTATTMTITATMTTTMAALLFHHAVVGFAARLVSGCGESALGDAAAAAAAAFHSSSGNSL